VIIRRLLLTDFLRYKDQTIDLPEVGVVAFTGANGAGKSSVLEGIAWTLWGRSLRGADDPGPAGSALVNLDDGLRVERQRAGRVTKGLTLHAHDDSLSGQTVTATQAKVIERWGTFERFVATRVFGRDLLSRFGTATNKERQSLLESILGFEQFSRAEKVARATLSERRQAQDQAETAIRVAQAALSETERLRQDQGPTPDLAGLQREMETLLANVASAKGIVDKARTARDRVCTMLEQQRRARSEACMRADAAKGELSALAGKVQAARKLLECPVCLRAAGEDVREAIVAHHKAGIAVAAARRKEAEDQIEALDADCEDLARQVVSQDQAIRKLQQDHEGIARRLEKARLDLEMAQFVRTKADDVEAAIAKNQNILAVATQEASGLRVATLQAQAAVEALGPRGARLRLFSEALGRLEAETNVVLGRLGMDLKVAISARKTQASGKEVDEVSVTLQGAGGGEYLGASGGERTRVDVAMILALGRLSGDSGLIAFDEVFDPLDDDGIERVYQLLEELAKKRQVLLTSHNPRLLAALPRSQVRRVTRVGANSTIEVG